MGKRKILYMGLIVGVLAMLVFAGGCLPGEADGGDLTSSIGPMVIFIGLFFAMMYFVMIRPQRAKQKKHQQLIQELKRGDRVITAGGIYGQVETVNDDNVVLKVESGATLRVSRSSVIGKQEQEMRRVN